MLKLSAEAKVGLLVLMGSIVLLYMTFAVGKYEFGEKRGYTLVAVFDSVAGLDAKAAVRMAGVKIGTVEKVGLEDSRAKVTLRIYPEVKIQRGTRAMVKTLGLLGEKYVELVPPEISGKEAAAPEGSRYFQEGERIQVTVSPSDVDKLINQLSSISDDVKQVTASLRQVFGSERGTRSMEDILADLRKTTENIKEFSYALRSDGSEVVVRLNELVASLNGVVGENRDNLKVTMENVREASKNAELALASLENTARKIDRGEGTLGKLVNNESMYNNIDNTARGLGDITSHFERLRTVLGFRSEYMFPDTKSYFTLDVKPTFDKYYTLEVISDPNYKFSQTVTSTNPPGTTVTQDTYENKFLFSLLFVKRWGNLALRMGLMESTGGLGAEYYAMNDKVKFSLDAWNFASKEPNNLNAHLKATVSYNLNKLFFIDTGFDNFLNSQRAAAFVGVGLRFDDEDLKYLMGTVPIVK